MEIDNYRNFLAIVEAGSMTSASEFVHIAQPALSKQLKSLEGYFGTKLIITTRGSKHLILTDAGKILYHKAKYICSLEDMARIEIDDISDGNRGTLRISAANSRSSIFIKTCLEPFHDLFPNVVYEIYEGSVNEQSQQLLSGITELGILSVPLIHQNDFEILFQREEDICAIFSKNSKFLTDIGDKETVSIKDLASLPLCASAGCNLIMNKIFKAHNLKPNILSICTTRTAALQWAEDDYGVSLVPIEPGEDIGCHFTCRRIEEADTELYKTVVKVKGRPLSVIARKFLKFYSEARHSQRVGKLSTMLQRNTRITEHHAHPLIVNKKYKKEVRKLSASDLRTSFLSCLNLLRCQSEKISHFSWQYRFLHKAKHLPPYLGKRNTTSFFIY